MNKVFNKISGIRFKAFLYTISMFVLYLVVVIALCAATFEGYVNLTRRMDVKRAYREINLLSVNEYSEHSEKLRDLTYKYNLRMIIKDGQFNTVFSNMFPAEHKMFNGHMEFMIRENVASLENDSYKFVKDRKDKNAFVTFVARLDSGYYLYISIPVTYVKENTRYMIGFMLILGLVAIFISFYASYKFAGKFFVKPILQMSMVTEKIKNLDFSEKCGYLSKDELGVLSDNINIMSDELKKNIESLRVEIENSKKVDEMRKNLIMNISHELKTPVFLIQSYAEGLRENIVTDEESKKYYCDVIVDETQRMDTMIKELLELARLEVGKANPVIEKVDFQKLADDFIAANEITLKNKNVVLLKDYENAVIYADVQLVARAVNNLITNAFDYVNENGTVKISAEQTEYGCRITVFNTGSHISEEDIEKIWYSFYKVDKSGNRNYGGTGIGLSIVKAVMESHNGRYGVANKENGVEFYIEFPDKDDL